MGALSGLKVPLPFLPWPTRKVPWRGRTGYQRRALDIEQHMRGHRADEHAGTASSFAAHDQQPCTGTGVQERFGRRTLKVQDLEYGQTRVPPLQAVDRFGQQRVPIESRFCSPASAHRSPRLSRITAATGMDDHEFLPHSLRFVSCTLNGEFGVPGTIDTNYYAG